MKISIQPSALADLRIGFQFYEKQQIGLGAYFLDSLYSDNDSLLLYAGIHSRHFGKYRLLSDRFPYAVYYQLRDDMIMVPFWISVEIQCGYLDNSRSYKISPMCNPLYAACVMPPIDPAHALHSQIIGR